MKLVLDLTGQFYKCLIFQCLWSFLFLLNLHKCLGLEFLTAFVAGFLFLEFCPCYKVIVVDVSVPGANHVLIFRISEQVPDDIIVQTVLPDAFGEIRHADSRSCELEGDCLDNISGQGALRGSFQDQFNWGISKLLGIWIVGHAPHLVEALLEGSVACRNLVPVAHYQMHELSVLAGDSYLGTINHNELTSHTKLGSRICPLLHQLNVVSCLVFFLSVVLKILEIFYFRARDVSVLDMEFFLQIPYSLFFLYHASK